MLKECTYILNIEVNDAVLFSIGGSELDVCVAVNVIKIIKLKECAYILNIEVNDSVLFSIGGSELDVAVNVINIIKLHKSVSTYLILRTLLIQFCSALEVQNLM